MAHLELLETARDCLSHCSGLLQSFVCRQSQYSTQLNLHHSLRNTDEDIPEQGPNTMIARHAQVLVWRLLGSGLSVVGNAHTHLDIYIKYHSISVQIACLAIRLRFLAFYYKKEY